MLISFTCPRTIRGDILLPKRGISLITMGSCWLVVSIYRPFLPVCPLEEEKNYFDKQILHGDL